MIRLATVFSGIGAVEHALNRMGIENTIVFACDNGDIDVLSKKIDIDIDKIDEELKTLKSLIDNIKFSNDDDYEQQLIFMLNSAQIEFDGVKSELNKSNIDSCFENIKEVLLGIIKIPNLNKQRVKAYTNFVETLKSNISNEEEKLLLYKIILKLSNDFKRDNSIIDLGKEGVEFKSSYNINWSVVNKSLKEAYDLMEDENGRKTIRKVRSLSQRVGQLHGKINSLNHLNKIKKLKSYKKKKQYVDEIYKGNEKRNKVKTSYMVNYNCPKNHFHWDASFLDGTQYNGKVDLFVGGSPCQSFSLVGKQRGLSDTRGTLFYEYARLVDEIQPKVFIYENVRAVLNNDCGKTWEKMKEVFKQLGYKIYFTNNGRPSILNAKDYGIPQNRNRLFVVGFRKDLDLVQEFEFPKPIPLEKTMQDFLIENPSEKYFLSERIKKTVLSPGTKNFYSKPETDLKIARPLTTTMHKMHRAGEDNYVTTDGRLRRLTPRECLRLMGFSDDWKIVVSDTAMYQQAGNSIVVDVLIHIINEILKAYPSLNLNN